MKAAHRAPQLVPPAEDEDNAVVLLRAAAGLFSPMMREIVKMSYLWRTPHSLDGSKLERPVGPLPSKPHAEAIRQAIADLELDGERRLAA